MWIVSFKVNGAVVLVLGTLWPAYLCLGLGAIENTAWLTHLGGAFGIATAICAWYASFADTLDATVGRAILPLKPLSQKVVDQPAHSVQEYEPLTGIHAR